MVCSFTVRTCKHWVPGTQSAINGRNRSNKGRNSTSNPAGLEGNKWENWRESLRWGRWGGRSRARPDGQGSVSVTPPEWAIRAPHCRPGPLVTAFNGGIFVEQLMSEGLMAKNVIISNSGQKNNRKRKLDSNGSTPPLFNHTIYCRGSYVGGRPSTTTSASPTPLTLFSPFFVQSAFSISSRFSPA